MATGKPLAGVPHVWQDRNQAQNTAGALIEPATPASSLLHHA